MNFVALSALINSALYIILVFAAGIYIHNGIAVLGAIITAGLCYLCAMAQLNFPQYPKVAQILIMLSIVSGIVAGVPLVTR